MVPYKHHHSPPILLDTTDNSFLPLSKSMKRSQQRTQNYTTSIVQPARSLAAPIIKTPVQTPVPLLTNSATHSVAIPAQSFISLLSKARNNLTIKKRYILNDTNRTISTQHTYPICHTYPRIRHRLWISTEIETKDKYIPLCLIILTYEIIQYNLEIIH